MGPRARARGNHEPLITRPLAIAASMGPRARARGNAAIGTIPLPHVRLQWGRERALAETLQPANGPHKFTSCNGAASALSRKRRNWYISTTSYSASMGPRARARGNLATCQRPTQIHKLQWGRERALAETGL